MYYQVTLQTWNMHQLYQLKNVLSTAGSAICLKFHHVLFASQTINASLKWLTF